MYIKFCGMGSHSTNAEIRDVRCFYTCPEECGMEDGSVVDGVTLCDGAIEDTAQFTDLAIQSLASYLIGIKKVWPDCRKREDIIYIDDFWSDRRGLAWFRSQEAAQRVLDEIGRALDAGKQFFDLTKYGDDGQLLD